MEPRLGRGLDSLIAKTIPEEARNAPSEVRLDDIRVNPNQPRRHMDPSALEGLAQSIENHGVLQSIVVRRIGGGRYELVAGERRYRASRLAGRATIPATVIDAEGVRSLELALIENIQRENLSPLDEAAAYEQLAGQTGLTHRELAERVGKSRSAVTNALRLLELPDPTRELLQQGQLSAGQARALLGAGSTASIVEFGKRAADENWSVREVERRVQAAKAEAQPKKASKAGKKKRAKKGPRSAYEDQLRELYGTKVRIQEEAGTGEVRFSFYGDADRDRLLDLLIRGPRAV